MAKGQGINKVIIITNEGNNNHNIHNWVVADDFTFETVSEFASFGELAPTIASLVNIGTVVDASSGRASKSTIQLHNMLDAPRWSKTQPIKVTCQFQFYLETDPVKDIINKMNLLYALHLLCYDDNGSIRVPGVNLGQMANISKELEGIRSGIKKDNAEGDSKMGGMRADAAGFEGNYESAGDIRYNKINPIFAFRIPGIVFLQRAMIHTLQPTYSSLKTESGFPLWAKADVQIQGVTSGFADSFIGEGKLSNNFINEEDENKNKVRNFTQGFGKE